jgi:hypothetical protein
MSTCDLCPPTSYTRQSRCVDPAALSASGHDQGQCIPVLILNLCSVTPVIFENKISEIDEE